MNAALNILYLGGALLWGSLAVFLFTSSQWFPGAAPLGQLRFPLAWFAVLMTVYDLARWYIVRRRRTRDRQVSVN